MFVPDTLFMSVQVIILLQALWKISSNSVSSKEIKFIYNFSQKNNVLLHFYLFLSMFVLFLLGLSDSNHNNLRQYIHTVCNLTILKKAYNHIVNMVSLSW